MQAAGRLRVTPTVAQLARAHRHRSLTSPMDYEQCVQQGAAGQIIAVIALTRIRAADLAQLADAIFADRHRPSRSPLSVLPGGQHDASTGNGRGARLGPGALCDERLLSGVTPSECGTWRAGPGQRGHVGASLRLGKEQEGEPSVYHRQVTVTASS